MKQNVITVALFAVLATMAVSCQKENLVEPQSAFAEIGTASHFMAMPSGKPFSLR